MKKYLVVGALLVALVLPNISLSQDSSLPEAGLTPDSPIYFVKSWKESIGLFFTFGAENKARQYLHLAGVRLAEYQKMIEKDKAEIAEKTLQKYEKQLNRALAKLSEAKEKGKDVKDLETQIEQATSKHLEVLQTNLAKVPEEAKKGIEKAIENSQKQIKKTTTSTPFVTVLSPNGGEKWEVGKTYEIKWIGRITVIYLSDINKKTMLSIPTSSSGSDSPYKWTIPSSVLPGKYYIGIIFSTPSLPCIGCPPGEVFKDESDAAFNIVLE